MEIKEFEKIDLAELKPASAETAIDKLLTCFEYDHLDSSVSYIGFLYQYTALYVYSRLDEDKAGTFDALLHLLKSRDAFLYEYFSEQVCK